MLPTDIIRAIARYLALPDLKLLMRTCRPLRQLLLADRGLTEACMRHYGTQMRGTTCMYHIEVDDPEHYACHSAADGTRYLWIQRRIMGWSSIRAPYGVDPLVLYAEYKSKHAIPCALTACRLNSTFASMHLPFVSDYKMDRCRGTIANGEGAVHWSLCAGYIVYLTTEYRVPSAREVGELYDMLRALAQPNAWTHSGRNGSA
jgi:hypothetical protein